MVHHLWFPQRDKCIYISVRGCRQGIVLSAPQPIFCIYFCEGLPAGDCPARTPTIVVRFFH